MATSAPRRLLCDRLEAGRTNDAPSARPFEQSAEWRKQKPMKYAAILDQGTDSFCLEYDDTIGRKNTMRLEAVTYDQAVREARAFLGIKENDRDEDGDLWLVE